MRLTPGNASHIGLRPQQQDAYALSDFSDAQFVEHGGYFAVLADGVGGMKYGAEASTIAVDVFMASYLGKSVLREVDETLDSAVQAANRAVLEEAERRDCPERMGTTLLAAVVYEDCLYWRSIGDSHLYLCREGRLGQLNADHNFARTLQSWVAEELISQNMADMHPKRGTLESFLGMADLCQIDCNRQPLPLQAGDWLLLCSDGIYGVLTDDEIIQCLSGEAMLAAQRLIDAALAKQHPFQDNLTAVVLACPPATGMPAAKARRFWQWSLLVTVALLAVSWLWEAYG